MAEPKAVLTVTGTSLDTTYVASSAFQVGRSRVVRFTVLSVRSLGSGATTTTVKLQFRYNHGGVTTAYMDLPSHLEDAVGAAQPKGSTYEIEHAFATAANATTPNAFRLEDPDNLLDVIVSVKTNAQGQTGDSTIVYMAA